MRAAPAVYVPKCAAGVVPVWSRTVASGGNASAALLAALIRDGEIGRFPETEAALKAEVERHEISRTVNVHVPDEPPPKPTPVSPPPKKPIPARTTPTPTKTTCTEALAAGSVDEP